MLGNKNKSKESVLLFDKTIFLFLVAGVFFVCKKLFWFLYFVFITKSFSSYTSYKTTFWVNCTVWDSFLRNDWQHTSSIIDNNNNDASECTSNIFWWDKFLGNSVNIIFTFYINQFLLLKTLYFILLQAFPLINLNSVFWVLNYWIICVALFSNFYFLQFFESCEWWLPQIS